MLRRDQFLRQLVNSKNNGFPKVIRRFSEINRSCASRETLRYAHHDTYIYSLNAALTNK